MTLLLTLGRRRPSLTDGFYVTGEGKSIDLTGVVNLVVDGNSIMGDFYTSLGGFHGNLQQYEPLASAVDTDANVAISGQTWVGMTTTKSDVDAAWVEGATNILFLGETVNYIILQWQNGETDPAAAALACRSAITGYLSAVRSIHPGWCVIIGGTTPLGGLNTAEYQMQNAAIALVDAWVAANVNALDLHAFIGYRNHAGFDHDGTTTAAFTDHQSLWYETTPRFLHPTDAGKNLMAQNVNSVVALMSA